MWCGVQVEIALSTLHSRTLQGVLALQFLQGRGQDNPTPIGRKGSCQTQSTSTCHDHAAPVRDKKGNS